MTSFGSEKNKPNPSLEELGRIKQRHPYMVNGDVATYTKSGNEHGKAKKLSMFRPASRRPDIRLSKAFHPRPTWERIPCPVRSSVPRPMMNPIMARRPFHCSAKAEKPKFESLIRNKETLAFVTDRCSPVRIKCAHRLTLLSCPPIQPSRSSQGQPSRRAA